jgi:hypothetical protein
MRSTASNFPPPESPEQERLVGVRDVEGLAIALGIDADRADAELPQGAEDADRDLTPICDQNLVEHERAVFSTSWGSRRPTS